MLLYNFLKIIVKISLRIFFKRFQIENADFLKTDGPLIVVGNHPNTFMDPLIAAALVRQRVAFLANGSIFNRFTRPVFDYFNVIPVYRIKDMEHAQVPLSQKELNHKTFKRCYDYLKNGGTILIFPEGTSEIERRLRDIKTGTARIALGAEAENDFKLNLKILALGLNYSDPTHFRSEVLVNVSAPIAVSQFKEGYDETSFEAVTKLTDLIEERFYETTIVTEDNEEDEMVRNIETLYKNKLMSDFELNQEEKKDEFVVIKRIVEAVRYFETQSPTQFKTLQIKMANYLESLQVLQISDETLAHARTIHKKATAQVWVLFLGFPLYVFGLIHNYIPYILPSRLTRLITSDVSYRAPMMMSFGILTFPMFYAVVLYAFYGWAQNIWVAVVYVVAMVLGGYFVLWYWPRLERLWFAWRGLWLMQRKPTIIKTLLHERQTIFGLLDDFKEQYKKVLATTQNEEAAQ
jgi:glycerol-3-phosphate O-acyltransferase / dihydroxyacetone phosphate acyltransferase